VKDTVAPGLSATASYTVTKDMSPGHLAAVVLSTPSMVGLVEGTCIRALDGHLDEGETSVGTHVCISHAGVATEGEEVVVDVRLQAVERRRLTFETTVRSPRGVISEGTHQRAVIDPSRFG
jgi:fluoroacetyl-CoA thioesterase